MEKEETLNLIKAAQGGDKSASEQLLTLNSPLIKSVIRRYKNKGVEYDDLYQLGCVGFIKAVKNFSTEYEVRFSTYAVPMIAGEVKRFLRDDGPVKVSRGTKSAAIKIARFVDEYKRDHGESPTVDKIAKQFDLEPQEAVFIMDSCKYPVSIYDSNDDNSKSLIDKLQTSENEDEKLDKMMLKKIINELSPRDKKIILLRYFADKTQSEVARVLSVSQVQISRLESKILGRIRSEYCEQ
ncbi:sigma-70 family RNA polymerase sigma factor [Anaerocaecibacter muris]|uniref:sigma-70 family RNA polymerase sigma factor n=1 Tax=Anaerocaecibacter muris TaxID=2941513 RepID=UPI00203D29B9|nr:sigma-70 family RNA polymerase sigma factor [Anaerocaecibacter muris]